MDAVARVLRWHRRSIAAVAVFVAVWTGLSVLRPEPAPTVSVAAASRDLPGGAVLAAGDLVVMALPPDAVPGRSVSDVGALVGRTLNAPVTARSPITEASVATGASLAKPGYAVMAVPVQSESLAGLLQAGTRVDLISSGEGGLIASDVRVLTSPETSGGGMLSSGKSAVLVEVSPGAAARLAKALDLGGVTIAVR